MIIGIKCRKILNGLQYGTEIEPNILHSGAEKMQVRGVARGEEASDLSAGYPV